MQSPLQEQLIIKWRRDLEPLLLLPADHDQMDKRYGLESHFLLFLTKHDFSSVMECLATKLLFIGPCLAGLILDRPLLYPHTPTRRFGTLGASCWITPGALVGTTTLWNWTHKLKITILWKDCTEG